jgi:uncharacterized membrane protein (UPF0136 family)
MLAIMASTMIVLWIYIVLLEVGGLMGFLKAGSKISLITSTIFAVPLVLCALGILPFIVAKVLIGVLAAVFITRYAKGKKFMPSGLMVVLSIAALCAFLFLH